MASLTVPIAVLGGLLAILAAVVSVARLRGWNLPWAARWRHAWSEAGYRLGGTWGEFMDWLRSPR